MKKLKFIFCLIFANYFVFSQNNGDFENWTLKTVNTSSGTISYQDPDNWQTLNFLSQFGNPLSAFRASGTDKYSGNYALKIMSVYLPNKLIPQIPDTLGITYNGKIITSPPSYLPGSPYTGRPAKLGFYSKYIPVGIDTGLAKVVLYRGLTTGRDTIATGRIKILPSGVYSFYEIILNYSSTANPDSAQILFSVSGAGSDSTAKRVGNTLYVDDVLFIGTVDIKEYEGYYSKIKLYPNPTTDVLTINTQVEEAEKIEVTDITGKTRYTYKIVDYHIFINTSLYDYGCYFYRVLNKDGKILVNGKFVVAR